MEWDLGKWGQLGVAALRDERVKETDTERQTETETEIETEREQAQRKGLLGNDQNVPRWEPTGMWVQLSPLESRGPAVGTTEATGQVGPGRLRFAGRMRWKDPGQGDEVHGWIRRKQRQNV